MKIPLIRLIYQNLIHDDRYLQQQNKNKIKRKVMAMNEKLTPAQSLGAQRFKSVLSIKNSPSTPSVVEYMHVNLRLV